MKDDTHYILVGRLMCIIQFFCRSNKFYLFYSGEDKCVRVMYLNGYHEAKKWTKKNYKTQKGKQVGEPISLERISVSSIDCVSCLQTQVLSQIGEAGLIV